MRILQYGWITPIVKKCTGCGAIFEYSDIDVKTKNLSDAITRYINCPVCGKGVIISREEY